MVVFCGTQPSPRTYSHHSAACSSRDSFVTSMLRLGSPCSRVAIHASKQRCKRGRFVVQAALPPTVVLSVVQQGAALAVTVVAEGVYTRAQLKPTAPGRPSILPIVASTLGLVAALGLVKTGEAGEQLGLLVGGVTSLLLLAINLKRSIDTEHDPKEFPGPKAWPIFVSTGAFFQTLTFFQALGYLQ